MVDTYTDEQISGVCLLLVDRTTVCGQKWVEAHQAPSGYTNAHGWFVAPYFDVALGFQDNNTIRYVPFPNIARPEPGLRYLGTENRYVDVTFHLVAEGGSRGLFALRAAVAWLSELNQPTPYPGNGRGSYAPPRLYLQFGAALTMSAIVEQCSIRWQGPWTVAADGPPQPMGADVSLTLCAVPEAFRNYGGDTAYASAVGGRTEGYGG